MLELADSTSDARARADFLADVLEGLARPQKAIPPKYFYDARGSQLFEAICETPEYYPTRTERALLAEVAPALAPRIAPGAALVEFGSGASEKTRLILDAAPQIGVYVPIDISAAALAPAAERIAQAYPHLDVRPIEGDFTQPLAARPELSDAPAIVGFFPGSTIGNFSPGEARDLLHAARALLGRQALFLVGADLVKPRDVLLRAYDDAAGVTAAFNLNLLARINRELGADFHLDRFVHRALWNEADSRIEMHLESLVDQEVHVARRVFAFRRGETLHTENSHKFTIESVEALASASGWSLLQHWRSEDFPFGEFLLG